MKSGDKCTWMRSGNWLLLSPNIVTAERMSRLRDCTLQGKSSAFPSFYRLKSWSEEKHILRIWQINRSYFRVGKNIKMFALPSSPSYASSMVRKKISARFLQFRTKHIHSRHTSVRSLPFLSTKSLKWWEHMVHIAIRMTAPFRALILMVPFAFFPSTGTRPPYKHRAQEPYLRFCRRRRQATSAPFSPFSPTIAYTWMWII